MPQQLRRLRGEGVTVHSLFLDATTDTLVRRFSETRRRHPLSRDEWYGEPHALLETLELERELLADLREQSHVIDTSAIRAAQLQGYVKSLMPALPGQLTLVFQSFAFKRGVPVDADYVFDVRMLPNPHYEPGLRNLTGKDQPVVHYLEQAREVRQMREHITHFLGHWLEPLAQNHRSYVTVAIGCTGGSTGPCISSSSSQRNFQTAGRRCDGTGTRRALDGRPARAPRLRPPRLPQRAAATVPAACARGPAIPAPSIARLCTSRPPAPLRPGRARQFSGPRTSRGCRCRSRCVRTWNTVSSSRGVRPAPLREPLQRILPAVEHGRAMQAGPDALGRPALQPEAPLAVVQQRKPPCLRPPQQLARAHGVILGIAGHGGHALRLQGAENAGGLAGRAEARAQIHQALRVAGHGLLQIVVRQEFAGTVPQVTLVAGDGQVGIEAEHPREHPPDIGVQNGHALREAEGGDRAGRGTADARQAGQGLGGARKFPAVPIHDLPWRSGAGCGRGCSSPARSRGP